MDYTGSTTTHTESLTTTKFLVNRTISTERGRFMTTDIKYFYYSTPLSIYKYMQIPLNIITGEIIQQYNLKDISVNGIVYIEIQKGIPGLKQNGKLADDCLCLH